MKNILILLTTGLLMLSACAPAQPVTPTVPGVGTIVAATLQAMTATAPTPAAQASGLPVSSNNISFTIPLELNASATPSTNTDVEYPYINPSGDPMPAHVVFQITNYPVEGDAKIMVFKSSEYAAYGAPLQDANQPLPDQLAHDFYAQAKPVPFQNGHGVRYLTEVLTNPTPITNRDLFYYYQGITNDGAYFVSAIFHVHAAFLVADGNKDTSTPSGGIPFNWGTDLDFSKYLGDVTQKLNDTPVENYTPSLILLDKMIGSLQVANP